ncbi:MAG: sarcosine oxidase [Pseudomonadota bacterium]
MTLSPTNHRRRSPLYRQHQAMNAEFFQQGDALLVDHYGASLGTEAGQAKSLGVVDLSCVARLGFKGPEASGWIQEQGLVIPELPNQAVETADGTWVARLSANEFMLLDNPANPELTLSALRRRHAHAMNGEPRPQAYLLERGDSHACLAVTGEQAPDMFAKLCAIDLRGPHFANGSVAQTSVASSNAIVIRADRGNTPVFMLLFDISLAEYQWSCVLDAMQEFGGAPIGLTALQALSSDT